MQEGPNNFAFIDGANLHKGIEELGWKPDYRRFRVFLRLRYGTERAYFFIGYTEKNEALYRDLKSAGYTLIFKPTSSGAPGELKGNCDVQIAWQLALDYKDNAFAQAVLVTGDGDFSTVALELVKAKKLRAILAPHRKRCSYLLKKYSNAFKLTYVEEFRNQLEYKPR
jgi:uncharacterized LabA/DUF88 family protein